MKDAKLVQWLGVRLEPSFCLGVLAKARVSFAERSSTGFIKHKVLGSGLSVNMAWSCPECMNIRSSHDRVTKLFKLHF